MKKITFLFVLLTIASCDVAKEVAADLSNSTAQQSLTNSEVISGLKEALQTGIQNAVGSTSVVNGFLNNAQIRLPFPPDAIKVKEKAVELGLGSQVDKFETTLNHAAEEATKEALPIFRDAILNMSISDGFAILNGGDGAATRYLKDHTTAQLVQAFSPKVAEAISKVKLTEYWSPIITKYNSVMALTGGQKVNPDLNQYVTERAIAGLFTLVEQEENKIRKDPAARVTELLQKVFGSVVQR